jgi:predicted transcriptional regulator
MAFDYETHRRGLSLESRDIADTIARIGHLLKTTGVFKVSDVIHGDSWNCLFAIKLLEQQGFIECAAANSFTQDHIFRRAT